MKTKAIATLLVVALVAIPLSGQSPGPLQVIEHPSAGNRYNKVYSVKDYNAIPDDGVDDTTEIQACITAAGNNSVIVFPRGEYDTNATLSMLELQIWEGNGSVIDADDIDGPIIKVGSGVNGTTDGASFGGTASQRQRLGLRDFYFKGGCQTVVNVDAVQHADFRNLRINNSAGETNVGGCTATRAHFYFEDCWACTFDSIDSTGGGRRSVDNVTIDTGTDQVTATGHPWSDDERVIFKNGTTLPGGVTEHQWLYVIYVDANTIQLAEEEGGTAIDFTGSPSADNDVVGIPDNFYMGTAFNANSCSNLYTSNLQGGANFRITGGAGNSYNGITAQSGRYGLLVEQHADSSFIGIYTEDCVTPIKLGDDENDKKVFACTFDAPLIGKAQGSSQEGYGLREAGIVLDYTESVTIRNPRFTNGLLDGAVTVTADTGDAELYGIVAADGDLKDIVVVHGGGSYTSAPTLTVSGTGAATATVEDGWITDVTITNDGSGSYTAEDGPVCVKYRECLNTTITNPRMIRRHSSGQSSYEQFLFPLYKFTYRDVGASVLSNVRILGDYDRELRLGVDVLPTTSRKNEWAINYNDAQGLGRIKVVQSKQFPDALPTPTAWFNFDQLLTDGTAIENLGSGSDGTLYGGNEFEDNHIYATTLQVGTAGLNDEHDQQSYTWDARSGEYLDTGVTVGTSGTICGWGQHNIVGRNICGLRTSTGVGQLELVGTTSGTGARLGTANITPSPGPGTGWHHYVLTYGGNGQPYYLYIDGEQRATGTQSGDVDTTESLYIGSLNDGGSNGAGREFDGWINDVMYFSTELTASQIADLYQKGL